MFDRGNIGMAAGGAGDGKSSRPTIRCAIYTRKSSEEGLEQDFNSLHAQREACEAYVLSQRHEGWSALPTLYDDGGFSGSSLQRPAVRRLMADIEAGLIDCVVVYKVDRLTRSLSDFARMVEVFDSKRVSFVSVTQAFNTTNSMGRLTLNVLLSFAQFEREVTGERIRDKIAASKKKGMWMGGWVPIGYDAADRTLTINEPEAEVVRTIFRLYLDLGNVRLVQNELHRHRLVTKRYVAASGKASGGGPFSRGHLYKILSNPMYRGQIVHKGVTHRGQHEAIIDPETWADTQALLKTNGHARRVGQNAKVPSLLSSLLVDEHGEPMKPVHANKDGRRYRYYVARAAEQGGRRRRAGDSANGSAIPTSSTDFSPAAAHLGDNRPPPFRLAAAEIEPLIIQELTAVLRDEQRIAGWLGEGASIDGVWRALNDAKRLSAVIENGTPSEQREALLSAVRQIQVGPRALWITLNDRALLGSDDDEREREEKGGSGEDAERFPGSEAKGKPGDGARRQGKGAADGQGVREHGAAASAGDIILHVPISLARRGNETKLILLEGRTARSPEMPDRALIKAVARAHAWWDELSSGRAASIQAIAQREGVTDRYVSQVINLAFLAPSNVEAVLSGSHAASPTANALMLHTDIPLLWAEQLQSAPRSGADLST